jgi:hypothetical protein
MSNLDNAKNEMVNVADRELRGDLSNDPIGFATLLFFLLNNKLESSSVDRMVAQLNAWINEKINRQNFTRFLDRELVSALFGLYILNKFKRLNTDVKNVILNNLLSQHLEESHYFNNYTYSVMIALSIADQNFSVFKELTGWINRSFEKEAAFNDAKKLVFTALLFQANKQEKELVTLVEYCYRKLSGSSVPYCDRVYYSWVVWLHRKLLPKEALPQITQLVSACLDNFVRDFKREESSRAERELYGYGIENPVSSRIALGVFIDLSTAFTKGTIRVSKEELAKNPILARVGSLFASILLVTSGISLYFGMTLGVVRKITIESWSQNPLEFGAVIIVDIVFMFFVVLLAATSCSLLWDTAVKGYVNSGLIKDNVKKRVKEWIKGIVIGNILLGVLLGIVLGL